MTSGVSSLLLRQWEGPCTLAEQTRTATGWRGEKIIQRGLRQNQTFQDQTQQLYVHYLAIAEAL